MITGGFRYQSDILQRILFYVSSKFLGNRRKCLNRDHSGLRVTACDEHREIADIRPHIHKSPVGCLAHPACNEVGQIRLPDSKPIQIPLDQIQSISGKNNSVGPGSEIIGTPLPPAPNPFPQATWRRTSNDGLGNRHGRHCQMLLDGTHAEIGSMRNQPVGLRQRPRIRCRSLEQAVARGGGLFKVNLQGSAGLCGWPCATHSADDAGTPGIIAVIEPLLPGAAMGLRETITCV